MASGSRTIGSRNGHIAMRTPDLDAAVAELREKGFAFKMDTAAYTEDGKLKAAWGSGVLMPRWASSNSFRMAAPPHLDWAAVGL